MTAFIVVDLGGAGDELDRLARGPGAETIGEMEAGLLEGYTVSETLVHVITGELKASGHPESSFTGDTWEGSINYARDPGIFELWRANKPTKHHFGGHYFFDPGGPEFEKKVRQAMWDWVTDHKGGAAPTGGLRIWSGGF